MIESSRIMFVYKNSICTSMPIVCAIVLFGVIANIGVDGRGARCRTSVTTVKGTYAPSGRICSGRLLFRENFDTFNKDIWKNEIAMGGGGVSSFQLRFFKRSITNLFFITEW